MAVKIFAFLVLAYLTGFDACKILDPKHQGRSHMKNVVKNYGSINFASDYFFLHEEMSYSRKILQHLKHPPYDLNWFHLIQIYGAKNRIYFKLYSTDEIVDYTPFHVKVNMKFLSHENCVHNIETVGWQISSKEPFCVVILACYVAPSILEESYEIRRRLIFITDENFNSSTLNSSLIGLNYKSKNTTFSNIYFSSGFCMCDYIDEYLNGCKIDDGMDIRLVILSFVLIFILFCSVIGIHLIILRDDAE
jgi:hypothetical protein